jgi:hypothetical protein
VNAKTKPMKLLTIFIFSLFTFGTSIQYEHELSPDYNRGLEYLKEHKTNFNRRLNDNQEKKAILVSVVFPEIVRYSLVRDLLETKSLEIGYVSKGSGFVDFSVGRFQMKPSFLESIERVIKSSGELSDKYQNIIHYTSANEKAVRKERIERLKSFQWQLSYLEAFYDITITRSPFLKKKTLQYKVSYLATAYNHGFLSDRREIEYWMSQKTYPYGTGVNGEQYAYSRVARYFYNKHYHSIFN